MPALIPSGHPDKAWRAFPRPMSGIPPGRWGIRSVPGYRHRVTGVWRRTVLVVEDHAMTRTLLTNALEQAGFDVVAVSTSIEALEAFEQSDPDLLITDVDLGSLPDGVQLARTLQAMAPHLAVLVLSNYGAVSQLPGGSLPDGAAFLSKTQLETTEALLSAVEAVLRDQPIRDRVGEQASGPMSRLTRRQLHLLRRMAEGWSNIEIADREGMTISALEKATTRMFAALGLRDDPRVNPRVVATRMFIEAFGPPRPTSDS